MLESGSSGSVRGRPAMDVPIANLDPLLRSYRTANRCAQRSSRSQTAHWVARANPSTAEQAMERRAV